jgi:hypothetical protein
MPEFSRLSDPNNDVPSTPLEESLLPGRVPPRDSLLRSVVESTEAMFRKGGNGDAAVLGILESVVARYGAGPLASDAAVAEMIEGILREEFRSHPEWGMLWPAASREIARTLWEDPTSRARLESLWQYLCERGRR